MCPLVNELKRRPQVQTVVCVTGQHKQMLQQVLDAFSVVPDYDLAIMQPNQTLFDVTTAILTRIQAVLVSQNEKFAAHLGAFSFGNSIKYSPFSFLAIAKIYER